MKTNHTKDEEVAEAVKEERERIKEELLRRVEGERKKQDGKVTMEFADGNVADISLHSDMALGYNKAIQEMIDIISKVCEKP